jgi:hypothetical protein
VLRRALVLVAIAVTFAGSAAAAAAAVPIYVTNESTVITDAQLQDALTCFQRAVTDDFAPVWHADAQLVFAQPPAGVWEIRVSDDSDSFGALAYHDVIGGAPVAKVFAKTNIDYGYNWETAFTHELFEMLADPWVNRAARTAKGWYMVEVGDPVEDDAFAYWRTTDTGAPCAISDFVTEAWYRKGAKGPYDFTGHARKPLQLLTGGYQLVWRATGWAPIYAPRR